VWLGLATLTEQSVASLDEGFTNIVKSIEKAKEVGGPILLLEERAQGFYLEVRFLGICETRLEFLYSYPVEAAALPKNILDGIPQGYVFDRVVWVYQLEWKEDGWVPLKRFAKIEACIADDDDSIIWN